MPRKHDSDQKGKEHSQSHQGEGDRLSAKHIQKYLSGVDYPASKEDLVAAARDNGAPEEVLRELERLPGEQFQGPPGVMKAFGQLH